MMKPNRAQAHNIHQMLLVLQQLFQILALVSPRRHPRRLVILRIAHLLAVLLVLVDELVVVSVVRR